MVETVNHNLLNDLLVALHRSLVQYAAEVSPWASAKAELLQQEVNELARRQQTDVGRLVHLLSQRDETVDFSHYPHEFTSLHFVSLDYLADRLVSGQRSLVQRLEAAADQQEADPLTKELLQKIAVSQREGLVRLLTALPAK